MNSLLLASLFTEADRPQWGAGFAPGQGRYQGKHYTYQRQRHQSPQTHTQAEQRNTSRRAWRAMKRGNWLMSIHDPLKVAKSGYAAI